MRSLSDSPASSLYCVFAVPRPSLLPPPSSVQTTDATWSKQRSVWVDLIRTYCVHHRLHRISLHAYNTGSTAGAPAPPQRASGGVTRDAQLVQALFRNDAIDRQHTRASEREQDRQRMEIRVCPPYGADLTHHHLHGCSFVASGQLSLDAIRTLLDALAADSYGVWEDSGPQRCSFFLSGAYRFSELGDHILAHVDRIGESSGILTVYELAHGDASKSTSFFGLEEQVILIALKTLAARGKCAIMPAPVVSETGVKFLG